MSEHKQIEEMDAQKFRQIFGSGNPLEHNDYETNREYINRIREAIGAYPYSDDQIEYLFPGIILDALYPKFQYIKEPE